MAYAALFSLAQTTNQILNDDRFPISDNGKHQITSLLEHLSFLQEFLEKFPNEASSFEVRIRHTANEAEDHLERLMYNQIQSHHMEEINDSPYCRLMYDMTQSHHMYEFIKEVAEKINSISKEAAGFKSLNTTETVVLGDAPTVKSLPDVGGVTVGLDDDLMKIKDLLCGESSKLESALNIKVSKFLPAQWPPLWRRKLEEELSSMIESLQYLHKVQEEEDDED